ncbi:hypothetical protein [Clostridium oryzae]|uniref:PepSY domain-containing protein n=1 Tax=Clostridium oryzae TaxID=1450648 RepID=A0A1V4IE35_9CLOT|nr:hypothetical protein [Clostridium oryzae]OPJ58124.1 hypothetical protein CLORY_37480 [Clostridium oryzae]
MKAKKVVGMLLCILLTGFPAAIHAAAGQHALAKNTLVTTSITNVDGSKKEAKQKKFAEIGKAKAMKIAVSKLKDWYGVTVSQKKLRCNYCSWPKRTGKNEISTKGFNYMITKAKSTICVIIEGSSGKIYYMRTEIVRTKSKIKSKYSLDAAKKIASSFIDKHNIINGKKTAFLKKSSVHASKYKNTFNLFFTYDNGNKTIIVDVNKVNGKVVMHQLL